jgi:RNA polymerase sigma factor (sigma-70 family)
MTLVRSGQPLEVLLAELRPSVLGTLVRRHGQFDGCEDAVQEALAAAAKQWPAEGVPDNPRGWLLTVAGRRLTDHWRSDHARRTREATVAAMTPADAAVTPAPDEDERVSADDDTLMLLFLCCHPALTPPSQVALTLRAVGGLTTEEIARAFLVPPMSMTRRISRAKQQIEDAGMTFRMPPPEERAERTRAVLHVLYLIFNEGYTATAGPDLLRPDLTGEAIRLTRQAHRLLPEDGEVEGLLALMLLTEARSPARTLADGALVPIAEQDRSRWNSDLAQEGLALVVEALARPGVGPYRLQAAIAAVHVETPAGAEPDWPQILALYNLLEQLAPSPVVRLNRAVALGMAKSPRDGLRLLEPLEQDRRMADSHRLSAVRAYLLEKDGDLSGALEAYRAAARLAASGPEQRFLADQVERVGAALAEG